MCLIKNKISLFLVMMMVINFFVITQCSSNQTDTYPEPEPIETVDPDPDPIETVDPDPDPDPIEIVEPDKRIRVINGITVITIENQQELDDFINEYGKQNKVKYLLKNGNYNLKHSFEKNDTLIIEGENKENTRIRGNLTFNDCNNVDVENLTIMAQSSDDKKYAIKFNRSRNSTIKNTKIQDAQENGVHIEDSEVNIVNSEILNNNYSNILYARGSKGKVSGITSTGAKELDGLSVAGSEVDIENSTFENNNQSGIYYYNGSKGTLKNINSNNNGLHGIEIKNSKIDIDEAYLNENLQNGLFINRNSSGVVKNITASKNKTKQGIQIQNSNIDINTAITNENKESGLYILLDSIVNISNLESNSNGINGVKIENSNVNILNSNFNRNTDSGVFYNKSEGNIKNINSNSNGLHGIEIEESNLINVTDSSVVNNSQTGIKIYKNSEVELFLNIRIQSNRRDGVLVENSKAKFEKSTAINNIRYGIIAKDSTITLVNFEYEGNGRGEIFNFDGSSSIINN